MAIQAPWGTPSRWFRMLPPTGDRWVLRYSMAAGAVLIFALGGLYWFGVRRVASPGTLAGKHHEVETKCFQCHDAGRNVADVRCGRCHDQSAVGRMENASHVLLGSGDLAKAAVAPQVACATCHSDHRGLRHPMRNIDDRECAACHRGQFLAPFGLGPLTSFQNHPEFSVAKAKRTTGIGLQFNHLTHFDYALREKRGVIKVPIDVARSAALQTCERCHTRTKDGQDIEPIRFQPSCSGAMCHTDSKGLLTTGTSDVTLKYILSNVPGVVTPQAAGDNEVQGFSGLSHRDPWVQFNAAWIRTALDPIGTGAERESLRASIAWLEQQVRSPVLFAGMSLADLRAWEASLAGPGTTETGRSAGDDQAALTRAATDIQDVLAKLMVATGQTASPSPDDDAALAAMSGGARLSAPDAGARFDERRAELLRLTSTVLARATASGDASLVRRANDLAERIKLARPQPAPPDDLAALRRMLDGLDDVFKLARQTADPQLPADLQTLQGLREYVGTRGIGGLDARDFEQRRQELSRLIETLRQSSNPDVSRKAIELGGRLAALSPAGRPSDSARRQADRRRWLDRVRLEIELQTSRDGATAAPPPVRETALAQELLDQNRASLALLDRAAGAPLIPDAERENGRQTLNGLLSACLTCHLFDGEDESRVRYFPIPPDPAGLVKRDLVGYSMRQGLRLAPVGAAEAVMKRAVFSHRPHLTATSCVTCHGNVIDGERPVPGIAGAKTLGSTLATDLNSPGVATCQTCHKSSGARENCAVCHVYHPPSAERLLRSVWSVN